MLEGVEVRMDGVPAPLFYVQSGQVNARVPYSVAASDKVNVYVRYNSKDVDGATAAVAPSAPALLVLAINQDSRRIPKRRPHREVPG